MKEEEYTRKRAESKVKNQGVKAEPNVPEVDAIEIDGDVNHEEIEGGLGEESVNPMSALLASARARAAEFEDLAGGEDEMDEDTSESAPLIIDSFNDSATKHNQSHESSCRAYDKIFKDVLSSADIVLYVLDARDPNGTRSQEVERQIVAADGGSKRLILILNKIDLIPQSVLQAWLDYLRRAFPTLPLRASHSAPNARTFDHKALTQKATSETLLRALKSYAHDQQLKRSVTVGIIGYPNVGKSSVINVLCSRLNGSASSSRSACPTGAEAGITTSLREVKLDNKLKLLDSPGIVFPSSSSSTDCEATTKARLALLSALTPKQITDPIPAISLLLKRSSVLPSLLKTYDLPPLLSAPNGDLTTDFLVQVARKRGRLGKGGVPNLNSAAMSVLSDWRDGRIQGWMDVPPIREEEHDEYHKQVVKEWSKEFTLEGLWGSGEHDADENMPDS